MCIDTVIFENKESAYEYAKQFKSRTDISKKNGKFYRFVLKNGWINDYYWLKATNIKWDYKSTYNEALKYTTKKDFEKYSSGAYTACLKNGWMKDYYWLTNKPYIKYTYDVCYEIAKKCESSTEMFNLCPSAYYASIRKGWKKDYTWFRRKIVNVVDKSKNEYFIYAYFDKINKFVYVGLSKTNKRDLQHRDKKRCNRDSVYLYFSRKNMSIPDWEILESNLTADEASVREGYWLNHFIENGWNRINKSHTGSLGAGNYKWTKDAILTEAVKYGSRYEFSKKSPSAYAAALKNKMLDLIEWSNPPFRWTKETAMEEAKKYKNGRDLYKHKSGLYQYLKKHDLLHDIFHSNKSISKEKAIEISQQYKYLSEFKEQCYDIYKYCLYKRWLNEFVWLKRKNVKSMSDDECLNISKKYKNKAEFKNNEPKAYNFAKKHKLLSKMKWLSKSPKKRGMTIDDCIKESKKFKSTKEFKENSYSAYRYAIRYKLLNSMHWLYN